MLKYEGYSLVLQEIPDEITLAINVTGCPYGCPGCHSMYLQEDRGLPLSENIKRIIGDYYGVITCVCFMGGDHELKELIDIIYEIRMLYPNCKVALYTGNDYPPDILFDLLDYIKVGHWDCNRGGLNKPETNQKMFKIRRERIDITDKFWPQKGSVNA